jgi:hypothetical protein
MFWKSDLNRSVEARKLMNYRPTIIVILFMIFLVAGCSGIATPSYSTSTPAFTYTPYPTHTPNPTYTPVPTATDHGGTKSDMALGFNLAGVLFEIEEWNPREIDLRGAEENGIPVFPGHSLKFSNFSVFAPDGVIGYSVLIEVYAGGELIGITNKQPLSPGVNEYSDIQIKAYQHDTVEDAWRVQDNWEYLQISTILYQQDDVIGFTENLIRLNPEGTSWFISSPYASIVSVVYRINDGPGIVADLRKLQVDGIHLEAGDKFEILEAWYQTDYKKSDSLLAGLYPFEH